MRTIVGFLVVGLIVLVGLGAFFHHGLLMPSIIAHPLGTVLGVLTVGFLLLSFHLGDWDQVDALSFFVALVLGVVWGIYGVTHNAITDSYIANDLNPTILTELPQSVGSRYLPHSMAVSIGLGDNQVSGQKLGDFDPIYGSDQQVNWVAPIEPYELFNRVTSSTQGFQILESESKTTRVDQPLLYGENSLFFDNVYVRLAQIDFFAEVKEVYYLQHNGEILTIAPYIKYQFVLPVTVPTWGGVFVIHPQGEIENLSPETAQADPRFTGQRLYPEKLARTNAYSWGYKNGLPNAWLAHKDQSEIPWIEDSDNQMPFLLPTTSGPMWFTAAEPFGEATAIYKLFFQNAHTGELQLYNVPQGLSLSGPRVAIGVVKAAFKETWYSPGGSNNVIALEPLPLVRDGVLYWQITVTTLEKKSVKYTAIVDSRTNDSNAVRFVNSRDELVAFQQGTFDGYPASNTGNNAVTSESASPVAVIPTDSISSLTTEQLYALVEQIVQELKNRETE